MTNDPHDEMLRATRETQGRPMDALHGDPMRRLCDRVATLYGNPSPSHAAACVEAEKADRPAFWTSTGWGDMTIQHVAWLATAGGELYAALERFTHPPRKEILDALVPLNTKALMQLRMGYMSVGLYPPIPSLHARQIRR